MTKWNRQDTQTRTAMSPGRAGIRMALAFGTLAIAVMVAAGVVLLIWRYEFRKLETRAQERDDKVAELGRLLEGAERRATDADARAGTAKASLDGLRREADEERRARDEDRAKLEKSASGLQERLAAAEQELKRVNEESAGALLPSGVPKLPLRGSADPVLAPGTTMRRTAEVDVIARGSSSVTVADIQREADGALSASGLPLSDASFLAQLDVRITARVETMLRGESHCASILVQLLQPTVSSSLGELRWTVTLHEADVVIGADAAELDRRLADRTRQLADAVLRRAVAPAQAPTGTPASPP